MLFNSYPFIFLFLPVCLSIFFFLSKLRLIVWAQAWLAIASILFYSYWEPKSLPILLLSICFNYVINLCIFQASKNQARALLWTGICFNLGLIGYYKYSSFLVSSLPVSPVTTFLKAALNSQEIILPLGISFFTFQQLAYLIDTYKGLKPEVNFLSYSLFVTFFPQLIAGPIVHHGEIIPQFSQLKKYIFSHRNFSLGLTFFVIGLFKKIVVADNLSIWVKPVFAHASLINFFEAWMGVLSYTFQLYFDFSGYSDMAIGLGLMLNICLPYNFDSPYKSTSIIEFWRRWHITLSNFLRDYLYIPLGGSRVGETRRYLNLLITMLLGGLWHGAGWTFILWGGLQGIYLCINHWWRNQRIYLPTLIAWGLTFVATIIGWAVFRANNLQDAWEILATMAGLKGIALPDSYQAHLPWLSNLGIRFTDFNYLMPSKTNLMIMAGILFWVTRMPNTQEVVKNTKPSWFWALAVSFLALLSLLSMNQVSEFLYFQF